MAEPTVRTVRFNDLPASTRERFTFATSEPKKAGEDRPIRAESVSTGGRIFGWVFLALTGLSILLGLWNADFGSPWRGLQSGAFVFWYALALFLAIFSSVATAYRYLLSKSLPYKEGRYLFPFDYIIADKDKLTIIPMSMLKGVRIVEHYRNGVYQYTAFHMDFSHGKTESFNVGKNDPDTIKSQLDGARAAMRKALEEGDLKRIEQLDLLFAAEQAGFKPAEEKLDLISLGEKKPSKAEGLPDWWRHRLAAAAAASLVLAPAAWLVRNNASDDKMWQRAQERRGVEGIEEYLHHGKRHIKEAKEAVYPVAFEEASRKKSVSALREMIRKYPESPFVPKAREAIHALVDASWEKFKKRAGENADPKLLAFMQKLLAYLEKNDTSTVSVKFYPPATDALTKLDADLLKKNIAPVSPHFTAASAREREGFITTAMSRGFGSVFPNDILQLERPDGGDALSRYRNKYAKKETKPEPESKAELPVMEIRYTVEPTDAIYKGKSSTRAFVGIQVAFDLQLKIPGDAEPLPIALAVLPPERFTVNYSTYRTSAAPTGPSDSQVYAVMAERAFDQFASKLAQLFFNETPREPLAPPTIPKFNPIPPPTIPPLGGSRRRPR